MPSKYDAIFPKLKELPIQDPSWQQKVDIIKRDIIADKEIEKTPSSLAKEYTLLREATVTIERQLKDIELSLEAYSQLLIETNDSNNTEWGAYGAPKSTLRLIDGASVRVQREPYTTVKDKDANRKWVIANGMERMLGIPWQTLNALTKELLLKGKPEPDGVEVFIKKKIVFTKAKVAGESEPEPQDGDTF